MLSIFAWLSIGIATVCGILIALDETRNPQAMGIMNVVWPVSALYLSVAALWAYYRFGRKKATNAFPRRMSHQHEGSRTQNQEPSPSQIAIGTSHCGAGCMLADLVCEFVIAASGFTLLGSVLWAEYAIDLGAAWSLGVVFQYFAIKPMRDLSVSQAIIASIQADTLSIAAFQVGMYAWMAMTFFVLFPDPHLTAFDPRYWLMMQIAMICGFVTAYPVNGWLIRAGIKEPM